MELIRREEGEGSNRVEFYTVVLTGQSGMSQSGLAVLTGVDQSTLSRLETTLMSGSPSETLKPFQSKPLTLMIKDPKIDGKPVGNLKVYKSSYCAAVLKHYAEQGRQTAIFSLIKFAEKGIDSWIQDITGWKQWQEKIQPHTDVYVQRIEHMRDHKISDDLWMIFREAAELLLLIEKDWQVPINEYDILDGSIGRRWSDYRKACSWAGSVGNYNHKYRDQRGLRECHAYEMSELPYFRKWLREVYVPSHLPQYLTDKYGKSATRLIYTENGLLTDYVLQITEVRRKSPADEESLRQFLVGRQKLLGGY